MITPLEVPFHCPPEVAELQGRCMQVRLGSRSITPHSHP
jgi:hypothetical protein